METFTTISFAEATKDNNNWVINSEGCFATVSNSEIHLKVDGVWNVFKYVDDNKDLMSFLRLSTDEEILEWEYHIDFVEDDILVQHERLELEPFDDDLSFLD